MRRGARTLASAGAPLPWLLALAAAGAVVAHMLAYWVTVPDLGEREAFLQETGHAYWGAAIGVAVLGGLWAFGRHASHQFRVGTRGHPGHAGLGFSSRLAAAQVAIFVAMEVVERLASADPVLSLLDLRVVTAGVVVQVLVALGFARLVAWLGCAAAAVARRLRRAVWGGRRPARRWAVLPAVRLPSRPRLAWAIRGPPWLSLRYP
ncbi:MAG: hypothetical protein ACRD0U_16105 [Acidimicrobiales bacterium]